MNERIVNEYLQVEISPRGGELQSVKRAGKEYLWQGDARTWPDRALNIFPYIARLTDGKYRYQGNEYQMDIHGFLPYAAMTVEQRGEDFITWCLEDNEATRKCYPFAFALRILYRLQEDTLKITYEVKNRDSKTMYFGLGGHPGFQVPLEDGLDFTDYQLTFASAASPYRIGMSEDCFVTGTDQLFALEADRMLKLRHDLFDEDAIILRDMSRSVTLHSEKGTRSITVAYPDMDYLGVWHWPRTEVSYICIEPWTSLPSRKGIVEDLEQQDNLISLEAGEIYHNT